MSRNHLKEVEAVSATGNNHKTFTFSLILKIYTQFLSNHWHLYYPWQTVVMSAVPGRKCIFGLWHLSVWKPTYNGYGYLPLQYHDGCCCASAALPAKLFRNVNHWPVVHKVTAANIWLLSSTNVYFLYCATVLACPAEVSCFTMNSSVFKITKYYCNNCVFTKSGTILIKKKWMGS